MTYETANEKLQGRNKNRRKIANNTYLERRYKGPVPGLHDSDIAVKLHDTDIITFRPNGDIVLSAGGRWRTVTTKARLNEFLPDGWKVYSDRGQWNIQHHGEAVALFNDGATLHTNGKVGNTEPMTKMDEKHKERRHVQKYAADYISALYNHEIAAPGMGDCFYCQLKDSKGNTMGENFNDRDHLISHMSKDERYFVPSLLMRAMEVMPVSQAMKWAVAEFWYPEQMGNKQMFSNDSYMRKSLQKILSRYILRQIGQSA